MAGTQTTSNALEGDQQTHRRPLTKYLHGDGIEIGALHNPLNIIDLPITRIRYVDRFDEELLRSHYPELKDEILVPVTIVDDGLVLSTLPNDSLDFVIANHVIEHSDNPLRTIQNWLTKLRTGGVIFLALPDKRVGWDENRPLTTIEHLVEDYEADDITRRESNYHHYVEYHDLVSLTYAYHGVDPEGIDRFRLDTGYNPATRENRQHYIDELVAMDYSIHFHVFTFDSFAQILDYARTQMHFPFEIVDSVKPSPSAWESVFVVRKIDPATCNTSDNVPEMDTAPADIIATLRETEATLEETQIALARGKILAGLNQKRRDDIRFRLLETRAELDKTNTELGRVRDELKQATILTSNLRLELLQRTEDRDRIQAHCTPLRYAKMLSGMRNVAQRFRVVRERR